MSSITAISNELDELQATVDALLIRTSSLEKNVHIQPARQRALGHVAALAAADAKVAAAGVASAGVAVATPVASAAVEAHAGAESGVSFKTKVAGMLGLGVKASVDTSAVAPVVAAVIEPVAAFVALPAVVTVKAAAPMFDLRASVEA